MNTGSSVNLCKRIKAFLHDKTFWAKHVYNFGAEFGLSTTPSPVRDMQVLCEIEDYFTLRLFRKIAKANCPNDYKGVTGFVYSFFSADEVTKSFYRAIIQAKTLYDVVRWIDKHHAEPMAELAIEPAIARVEI